ncbi:hypothetical protein NUW58_g7413 [Xylaria curta]|uniref:Uncharacterized protein n=1 Tax=Xylaria curta TaxID=42375 RepID=A0ACC1NID7_9PEZI|nr:hypothetical protein NUW58_g7413 [Xylaria curta]
MSSLEDPCGLNWLQPGKKEVAVVGKYVADEAPRLHDGFGGPSRLDIEQVKFVADSQPYNRLERALKDYITETLRIQVTTFDPGLCDRIGDMEKAYRESKQGLWHRFWYGCGDVRDIAEAWLELIPDEYGLSVLKAGVAVVFKLAENSKNKREKVFKTFSTLQEALVRLRPGRARFRADPEVGQSAASLYKAIVRAIEAMMIVLPYMGTSRRTYALTIKGLASDGDNRAVTRFAARLKHENELEEARPTLDGILEALETDISKYDDSINLARDHTHERTEAYSRINAVKTALLHDDTAKVLKAMREGERGLKFIVEQQRENRTLLMHLIMELERRKAINAEVVARRQRVLHSSKHKAVVSLTQLCKILAQPLSAKNQNDTPNLERTFQQPNMDLSHALAEQGRFSLRTQGQVNSLLEHEQFLDWLSRSHPSLILVDANIRESALEHVSAISVFSSTLVTSLIGAYPDTAVVVHFFCGLHASPYDAWYGPTGLVRSLILQLLMKLDARDPEMRSWSLDFINDRGFLQNLEQHSLLDLCSALHWLLYEFTPDTYVYCIVDSISCFDVSRLLKDLGIVMEELRKIVNDKKMVPVIKILLTNPFESTRAIKNIPLLKEDPARLISLNRNNLVPGSISSRVVDDHLLRAPSPLRGRTPSPVDYSRVLPPVASAMKRITGPVAVVREIPFDGDGDGDENVDWDDKNNDTR